MFRKIDEETRAAVAERNGSNIDSVLQEVEVGAALPLFLGVYTPGLVNVHCNFPVL